ncbi:MAG: hypothetical protein IBX62_03015 [Coriobacteriia bacterium]|nr:hypothetical protein [Coriobacteriia bacterium]
MADTVKWEAVKTEYDKVQTELSEYYKTSLTVSTGAIGSILIALGWLITTEKAIGPVAYLAVPAIAIPALGLIRHCHESAMRLGTYIATFLEQRSPLAYESRNLVRSKLGGVRETSYPGSVASLILLLVVIDALLFIQAAAAGAWDSGSAVLTGSLGLVGLAVLGFQYRMVDQGPCARFRAQWSEVRRRERAGERWDPDHEKGDEQPVLRPWDREHAPGATPPSRGA